MTIIRGVKILLVFTFLAGLSACAVDRSTVSVDPPESIANPVNGVDVKLVSVTDNRMFEFRPTTPDIPSLSEDEINNDSIKARAFARKRNSYGKALGDVVLPENQTVAGIMKPALENAFRAAGYRVLEPGDPAFEKAIPIDVKVVQFWSWIDWGFWELGLHNKAEVSISASEGSLAEGITVFNETVGKHAAVFDGDWQKSAATGIKELTIKVTEELKKKQ